MAILNRKLRVVGVQNTNLCIKFIISQHQVHFFKMCEFRTIIETFLLSIYQLQLRLRLSRIVNNVILTMKGDRA